MHSRRPLELSVVVSTQSSSDPRRSGDPANLFSFCVRARRHSIITNGRLAVSAFQTVVSAILRGIFRNELCCGLNLTDSGEQVCLGVRSARHLSSLGGGQCSGINGVF